MKLNLKNDGMGCEHCVKSVREALEAEGIEFLEAAVKMVPDTYTAINEDDAKKFQK